MNFSALIAKEFGITTQLVDYIINAVNSGQTTTFLARYRANDINQLDGLTLDRIVGRYAYLENLEKRKEFFIGALGTEGVLDTAVEAVIRSTTVLAELERYCKALIPEKGSLVEVAKQNNMEAIAEKFMEVSSVDELGALPVVDGYDPVDLVVALVEEKLLKDNQAVESIDKCAKKALVEMDGKAVKPVAVKPHQLLAARRNKRKIEIVLDDQPKHKYLEQFNPLAKIVADDIYDGLVGEKKAEIREDILKNAELKAIEVFSKNLENLLLTKGIKGCNIMAVDPGFKNGCKIAVIDVNGSPVYTKVHYLGKLDQLADVVGEYGVKVIGIGNGTGTVESMEELERVFAGTDIKLTQVNESGASIYSTSKTAVEEFGSILPGYISAISLARRVQDPLAELVKVPVESLGIGQYQHDVSVTRLREELAKTVEQVVNKVGVDVNTASRHLLQYVNGLNKATAKAIISYRESVGRIERVEDIQGIRGISARVFEQCAGFLRVHGGPEPLDATGIHPADYAEARQWKASQLA